MKNEFKSVKDFFTEVQRLYRDYNVITIRELNTAVGGRLTIYKKLAADKRKLKKQNARTPMGKWNKITQMAFTHIPGMKAYYGTVTEMRKDLNRFRNARAQNDSVNWSIAAYDKPKQVDRKKPPRRDRGEQLRLRF